MTAKKETLHGVKSESTREMFKELKKRGFTCTLEKGSNDTYKIKSFINGVEFVLSCIDGAYKKYTKNYARNKWEWKRFDCVDDLLISSMIKKDSSPTEKQSRFFNTLVNEISSKSDSKVKIKIPVSVSDMADAINEAVSVKSKIKYIKDFKFSGSYITI